MYTPAQFEETRPAVLHALIREFPLAVLISAGPSGLQASHVPLILSGNTLRGHLARANPHWKELAGASVLAVFSGPEHYVTPSWYPSKAEHGKVVPTWNYVAVHAAGRVRLIEEGSELLQLLDDLTRENESAFQHPWQVPDAPAGYIEGLMGAIVGFELTIDKIEGKWKLSQNRPDADRRGVREGLGRLDSPRAQMTARKMSEE